MGGGVKKVFLHLLRGVQKVLAACEGGQKSLTSKNFNCSAPHQSIYEHSLSHNCADFDKPLYQFFDSFWVDIVWFDTQSK